MIEVEETDDGRERRTVTDTPLSSRLFQSTGAVTWVWLVLRIWLGWQWLSVGWSTLGQQPQWPAVAHVLLGLALIVGAFVGIAATAGVVEDVVALATGAQAEADPLQLAAAILLVLAWKNAGYLGADRLLLRLFGAPWSATQVPHVSRSARAAAPPKLHR
jgi:thiosulfate dehydrogenase [quinone] large subunit